MSTIQCSESMHAFFDGYNNSKTTLKQFVEQHDNILSKKVQLKAEEDARCFNTYIPRVTPYEFERQFQDAYTLAKFKEFKNEIAGMIRCNMSSVKEGAEFSEFDVEEDVIVGENNIRLFTFHVHFNEISREANCTCRLFEFRGILCKHIIIVYLKKKIYQIPWKYILEGWSKNVRRSHTKIKIKYDNWERKPKGCRYENMLNIFNRVSDKAMDSDEKSQMVMSSLLEVEAELDVSKEDAVWNRPMSIGVHKASTSCHDDNLSWQESNNRVCDPIKHCQKGRPPEKRRQSKIETIIKKCRKTSKKMTKKGTKVVDHREIITHPVGLEKIITQETVNLTVSMPLIYYMFCA